MDWLSKIEHQNIVSLLGYCIHGEARFLVYEIMHNGSLESQLHGPSHGSTLTWHLRMKIALDVSRYANLPISCYYMHLYFQVYYVILLLKVNPLLIALMKLCYQ
ncbi:hypothetical protein ACSBR2_035989 [Camellia fascicularis]